MAKARLLGLFLLAILVASAPAAGGEGEPPPAATQEEEWTLQAGGAVVSAPAYPGSRTLRTLPIPAWNASWKGRFFSRGSDFAGVHLLRTPSWNGGASLHYDFSGREPDDDRRLAGLDSVGGTVRAKLFGGVKASLVSLSAKVSQDVAGGGQGLLAGADASLAVPFLRGWFFAAGPGLTFGDRRYADAFFGVSPAESARSGLPVHRPGGGVVDVHVNGMARRSFSERWSASLAASVAWLQGDAARSPVTEERLQPRVMLMVTRRFLGPAPGGRTAPVVPPGP